MSISLKEIKKHKHPSEVDVKAPASSWYKAQLNRELGGQRLKDAFRESLYSELALLLEAGMNIKSALDLIAEQQKKEKYQALIIDIVDQLTQGGRFSEVLKKSGKFSTYEYFSIQIGEETGNLVEVLKRLTAFYHQKIQQKRELIGALTYPAVILLTAFLAVAFMLSFMVPMFEDVFSRMGNELPALTKGIISLSENFHLLIWAAFILLLTFLTTHFFFKNRKAYKNLISNALIRIPFIGPMILKTYMLRLIQSLSLLMSSRVPLTEALDLSARMVRFYPIQSSLAKTRDKIMRGSSLHQGLQKFTIYDKRLLALIRVGEETNQLGSILAKLSNQIEAEVQHRAKMLGNTLEPLIIIFLGFLVALILIAMYLPMFQLSSTY